MRIARLVVSIGLLATFTFAGCGGEKKATKQVSNASRPKENATTKSPASRPGGENGPPVDSTPVPPIAGPGIPPINPSGTEPSSSFQPPFPNRTNPFRRPNFAQSVKTNSASQEDVKLRGFVNVNGVRALLAINGKINRVREGETRQGVQVIRIIPPNVILQKGRVRWTQKLFDGKPRDESLRAGLPPNLPF